MIALLISLTDFPDFVPFSVNIDPLLVTPHIRDAQTFDVWPLLPANVRDALPTALELVVPEFAPTEFEGSEFETTAATMGWSDLVLAKLWYEGIRPLLVCEAARRMLLWHGSHVTPNGLETISDIGHAPVSGAVRTELRSDLQSKCAHYRALLDRALRNAYPSSYSATCAGPRRRPSHGGLTMSAI